MLNANFSAYELFPERWPPVIKIIRLIVLLLGGTQNQRSRT